MSDLSNNYDAAVIGAGPAGAVSAMLLAQAGLSVVLIDKAQFPRDKVCGSCLSARTLGRLKAIGLSYLAARLQSMPIESITLRTASGAAVLPLPVGRAVSRRKLDSALVEAAVAAGATFMPQTNATVEVETEETILSKLKLITLNNGARITAKSIIVADGTGGRALVHIEESDKDFVPVVKKDSRIGLATTLEAEQLDDAANLFYRPGSIYMAVNAFGYIGFVRMEEGKLDAAAAFSPQFVKASGSPQAAARTLMTTCGMPFIDALETATWLGTPPFSRRRKKIADAGLFVIGDAAAYSEPFTGEGIGWAIASAQKIAPIVLQSVKRFDDKNFCLALAQSWQADYKRELAAKQMLSTRLGTFIRNEGLTNLVVGGLLSHIPAIARPLILSTSSKIGNVKLAAVDKQQKIGGKQ
jgi:flavin-dependent dehydrogenase